MSSYDLLTDRACRVIGEMREEAVALDHDHTGTEQLLLAILHVNDDLTSPVLRRFGVIEADLRRQVKMIVTPDPDPDNEGGVRIGFTAHHDVAAAAAAAERPDLKESPRKLTPRLVTCLMRLAPFEARELGDEHVGPEHLLLAVLKEGHGVGVRALTNLDVDIPQLTMAVYARIAEAPGSSDPTARPPTDEDREAKLEMRRAMAQSRMSMEDRIVFTTSEAARVYCVLDGIDRLLDSGGPMVDEVTDAIRESFKIRGGDDGYTGRITPDQERRIVRSTVSGLRRQARGQLED
jgi:ATP-dependent Clp protease ATP-binding subunit ClpA